MDSTAISSFLIVDVLSQHTTKLASPADVARFLDGRSLNRFAILKVKKVGRYVAHAYVHPTNDVDVTDACDKA